MTTALQRLTKHTSATHSMHKSTRGWCALWGPRPTATVFATMETFVGELCNASVASRVDLCIECVADVCFVRRCNAVVMLPCLLFPCTWVTC